MNNEQPTPDMQPTDEHPIIVIEHDDDDTMTGKAPKPHHRHRMQQYALTALFLAIILIAAFAGYRSWGYFYRIGVPISVTPEENIEKLTAPLKHEEAQVIATHDSVLGVALDLFEIHGMNATLQFEEPDTADTSVYLYARSADHHPNGEYEGSLVVAGEEKQSDRSRLGYMAMVNGRMVIGISRSDKVKDYVAKRGGSFFRQYILVSDGKLPGRFHLHGKVERRAIGRMGEQLYYIVTPHKETLWDFADALREYGFTDAIYITGGNDYGYYRSRDGQRHDILPDSLYPHKKWAGIVPWLVFRARH